MVEEAAQVAPAGAGAVPYRMTPMEVTLGWLYGGSDRRLPPPVFPGPLQALESAIRPALHREQCVVLFSGGRDSSAVLAAALALARRERLPEPAAVTHVYPGDMAADEGEWQERVVRHLRVRDWQRIEVEDEKDLVGPVCGPALRRHGLVFPATTFANVPLYERLRGASVLTGQLGDEVFGAHRAIAWHRIRHRSILRPHLWAPVAAALAPRPVRLRCGLVRERSTAYRWLRPEADALRIQLGAEDHANIPLDWRTAVYRTVDGRAVRIGVQSLRWAAALHDVSLVNPLMNDAFLTSFARHGGRTGYASRARAMAAVFGDLLPAEVLRRVSKATFNASRFGRHAREFARSWDGTGVDHAMVDPDCLREEWLAAEPHAMTASLLQQAWLASDRGDKERRR